MYWRSMELGEYFKLAAIAQIAETVMKQPRDGID